MFEPIVAAAIGERPVASNTRERPAGIGGPAGGPFAGGDQAGERSAGAHRPTGFGETAPVGEGAVTNIEKPWFS